MKRSSTAQLFKRGDRIRLTRDVSAQLRTARIQIPAGTIGEVTSVGENYLWALLDGRDTELFPDEYEAAS